MPESPFTQYRNYQYNGPNDSSDYNAQMEERYKDLVILYNWLNQVQEQSFFSSKSTTKELLGLSHKLGKLEDILSGPGWGMSKGYHVSFKGGSRTIDTSRFEGDSTYEISEVDQLMVSRDYPGIMLPPSGSTTAFLSGLFIDNGTVFVPGSVESNVVGRIGTADSVGSIIDTTQPELSFGRIRGPNWERNVIENSPNSEGAVMSIYIKVPSDVSPNRKSNYITLNPYPIHSVDILNVAVSTKQDVMLKESDGYITVNYKALYSGEEDAVGITPPGAWNGDVDLMSGNRMWVFEPQEVTAVRIDIRQRNYYIENNSYVYTYGANFIDVGYLKTLETGKTIVRLDAPPGTTFNDDIDITPQMFNISQAYYPDVFSYKIIWETAEDSGIYTEDVVPFSRRAWAEITLNKAADGTVPVLSGIYINKHETYDVYDDVYVQASSPPGPSINDIWIDTSGATRAVFKWDGTAWVEYTL